MKSLFLSQSTQLKEFKNYKIASYEINFHNGNDTFQATLDFDVVLTELQKKIGGSMGYLKRLGMALSDEHDGPFDVGSDNWKYDEEGDNPKRIISGKCQIIATAMGSIDASLTWLETGKAPILLNVHIPNIYINDISIVILDVYIDFMAEI